jgi:DNA-binding winged helix-turn-helix (wHTH) protein
VSCISAIRQPKVVQTQSQRVRLGAFEVDLRAGELRAGNRTILLQEQPFQILLMLLERRGQLVSRDQIRKKLWSDETFVDFDHGINAAIKKLRRALGDSADEPKYVETVARRGYRLMVAAQRLQAEAGASAIAPVLTQAPERHVYARPERMFMLQNHELQRRLWLLEKLVLPRSRRLHRSRRRCSRQFLTLPGQATGNVISQAPETRRWQRSKECHLLSQSASNTSSGFGVSN